MPTPQHSPKPDPMSREVDRLLAGLATLGGKADAGPGADSNGDRRRASVPRLAPAPDRRASRPGPRPARRSDTLTRADLVALWARALLGVALGALITQWPYVHACGMSRVQYFGAVTMVIVAGGWVAVTSWKRRHAPVHVLALLLVLWGVALAAYEVLPRVGYAAQQWRWQC